MKKVLIIRLDGLGDTLLSTPLVDSLIKQRPDCQITYLASPRGAPVFEADSRINALWVCDLGSMTFAAKIALARRIHHCRFDAVFCLNEKLWPAIWAWLSSSPQRIGFDPGWGQFPKALLRRITLNRLVTDSNCRSRPARHEVERYSLLLSAAGYEDVPDALKIQHSRLLPAPACVPAGTIAVGLHLSAKWSSDGWGGGLVCEAICTLLQSRSDIFIIVTGSPDDADIFFRTASSLPPSRYCLCSQLSFAEWASVIQSCRCLVTMDTGSVHLSAAVGTPVVDIFPAAYFEHNSSRWAPWRVPCRIVRRPADPADRIRFLNEIAEAMEALL